MGSVTSKVEGFLLAGGRSSRMGRDKALLPYASTTLAGHIATQLRDAAGNVTILAPPERYAHLGFPVLADAIPDCGPLGGLYTALRSTTADWNLIVACDLPHITAAFLRELLAAASAEHDCIVAEADGRLQPLCAVYHRRLLPAAEAALHRKLFKMHDFIEGLQTLRYPAPDASLLRNVNTPDEWEAA
jgi:molybdopterin-guanine dinucleotide biosynthesis protein A